MSWEDSLVARVAVQIRRLRKAQNLSAQSLSDVTAELGSGIPRTTIADIELGRRRYVSVSELIVLAAALNTTPTALVFPGPYDDSVELLPGLQATQNYAAHWFAGTLGTPADPTVGVREVFLHNTKALSDANTLWGLEADLKAALDSVDRVTDEGHRATLLAVVGDIQQRIAALRGADDGG